MLHRYAAPAAAGRFILAREARERALRGRSVLVKFGWRPRALPVKASAAERRQRRILERLPRDLSRVADLRSAVGSRARPRRCDTSTGSSAGRSGSSAASGRAAPSPRQRPRAFSAIAPAGALPAARTRHCSTVGARARRRAQRQRTGLLVSSRPAGGGRRRDAWSTRRDWSRAVRPSRQRARQPAAVGRRVSCGLDPSARSSCRAPRSVVPWRNSSPTGDQVGTLARLPWRPDGQGPHRSPSPIFGSSLASRGDARDALLRGAAARGRRPRDASVRTRGLGALPAASCANNHRRPAAAYAAARRSPRVLQFDPRRPPPSTTSHGHAATWSRESSRIVRTDFAEIRERARERRPTASVRGEVRDAPGDGSDASRRSGPAASSGSRSRLRRDRATGRAGRRRTAPPVVLRARQARQLRREAERVVDQRDVMRERFVIPKAGYVRSACSYWRAPAAGSPTSRRGRASRRRSDAPAGPRVGSSRTRSPLRAVESRDLRGAEVGRADAASIGSAVRNPADACQRHTRVAARPAGGRACDRLGSDRRCACRNHRRAAFGAATAPARRAPELAQSDDLGRLALLSSAVTAGSWSASRPSLRDDRAGGAGRSRLSSRAAAGRHGRRMRLPEWSPSARLFRATASRAMRGRRRIVLRL